MSFVQYPGKHAAFQAQLCFQYGSGASIGSGVLFPGRAFMVSCGMREDGLNRM